MLRLPLGKPIPPDGGQRLAVTGGRNILQQGANDPLAQSP